MTAYKHDESNSTNHTPLTFRLMDTLPGNPWAIGLIFTLGLLLLFVVGRWWIANPETFVASDFRIAMFHILQVGYAAAAYSYALISARRTTRELTSVVGTSPAWQTALSTVGTHTRWKIIAVGLAFCLVFGITMQQSKIEASIFKGLYFILLES